MEKLTYRLEVYEGPLDLLLDLIAKNKIDIMNIPIALICDQYMAWLARRQEMDLEGAFLASRKYSDRIYDRSLSGEISMEEMYIYRLGNAFRDYGKIIDGATALQFQSVYEKHQHNIHMTREMEGLLEKLRPYVYVEEIE